MLTAKKRLRVLFVSGELIAGDLAYQLKKEGCDVKLYIEDKSRKDCFDGMVEKTSNWRKELSWVGKDGLIVFDDVGYGKIQDDLRRQGYLIVGGSEGSDKLEQDREFGQKVLAEYGVKMLPSHNFNSADAAIDFVKRNPKRWVLKQNGHTSMLNYVGEMEDGSDVTNLLKIYKDSKFKDTKIITLQERVYGVEIGVARYFNGDGWVGPIEINFEHKSLCNDDVGPKTGEMGTLMFYVEKNRLFEQTLRKLEPYLKEVNFKGDIDINFIVNKEKVFPLEFTCRFGCPSTQLQQELNLSSWKDFLLALAKGKQFNLNYKKSYGIIISIVIPPFPYKVDPKKIYQAGTEILFKKALSKREQKQVHFEEVSSKNGKFMIAGKNGFILYISGSGKSIMEARKRAYSLVRKIIIPKMFYRTDIGLAFLRDVQRRLRSWKLIN